MARQRRSAAAAPRRPASTTAMPSTQKRAGVPARAAPAPSVPATQTAMPQQPGLLAQAAATAGGVAVGSAVGHGIANVFGRAFAIDEQARETGVATIGYRG